MAETNYVTVTKGIYIVKNEAGFKEACDEFWKDGGSEKFTSQSHQAIHAQNTQLKITEYPSLIALNLEYVGEPYIEFRFASVEDFHKNAEALMKNRTNQGEVK